MLCLALPAFVSSVRQQGATADVLDRLNFFSEMNSMRAVFRTTYTICFVSAYRRFTDTSP